MDGRLGFHGCWTVSTGLDLKRAYTGIGSFEFFKGKKLTESRLVFQGSGCNFFSWTVFGLPDVGFWMLVFLIADFSSLNQLLIQK